LHPDGNKHRYVIKIPVNAYFTFEITGETDFVDEFLRLRSSYPPIFSNISEIQRPSACISESVQKIGGTTAALKNCLQNLFHRVNPAIWN